MPKSKREKIVHLTKTTKRTRAAKDTLIQRIRELCDSYSYIYLVEIQNSRNVYLQGIRQARKDDRLVFAANKVMAKALGVLPQEEHLENLSLLAKGISGAVSLMFSNSGPDELVPFFEQIAADDYARGGAIATEDVMIPSGPLKTVHGLEIPHSMEVQMRQMGLPTKLVNGKVILTTDYKLCTKGSKLTSDQARALKSIGIQLSRVSVKPKLMWAKGMTYDITQWPTMNKLVA